uniref:C2H2-type domain-containing protein n=1 Tax=Graphocephala atropunctata TaxID=36148 RepID=A0A1B6KST0_9HEMI
MQCYPEINLQCCDCKSTFTSAFKLLQHFADHVQKETKVSHKKKRHLPGKQVRQAESGSESSLSRHESTLSASDSCSESSQSCKLAKFDLQKRLESCVKQDDDVKEDIDDLSDSSPDTKAEEYSPLKFCMITMEESDEKPSKHDSPKKIASRKQLLPKKIERKVEELRKLAPKPENPVSAELTLQSSGKKKYACHLCTKVFGWSTDLKRHILVHTGERPFKCKNCQATFTRNFLLQKHQSKVHPCKPKESAVTPETVEVPSITVAACDTVEIDPLKEEAAESNECDDDEDEGKLIITEEIEEKSLDPLSNCTSDSKWHIVSSNAERRCSDLKQTDLFHITPVKVLTM